MAQPRISVVIPVYQVENFLPRCLDALLAQTEPDFELLLVDDGSTDHGGVLCDRYAAKDARIHVLHQPNRGVSAARNSALRIARGEVIAFCDPDDWMEPAMLRTFCEQMTRERYDAAFCGFYEERPNLSLTHAPPAKGPVQPDEALRLCMKRGGYFTSVWNKAFRREAITDENGCLPEFDESVNVGEDELWLVDALQRCRRVCLIPQPLYHWLWRRESAIHETSLTERRLTGITAKRRAIEKIAEVFPRCLTLAQACLYDDSFYLLPMAYGQRQRAYYQRIRQAVGEYGKVFLFCRDIPLLRRCKVVTLRSLMACRFSPRWVLRIASVNRTLPNRPQ